MDLFEHLRSSFPEQSIEHKPMGHYDIFESEHFRMNVSVVDTHFHIHYLQVSIRGKRYGDVVVAALIEYCKVARLVPFASHPENYKNFWCRNNFEPLPDNNELWVHEDWNYLFSEP